METVAGTDPARQRAFEAQVFGYHAAVRGRVTDAIFACKSFDRAAFEAAPGFTYREPDRGVAGWLGIVLAGGLALLFMKGREAAKLVLGTSIAAVALIFIGTWRYRVRPSHS